MEYLKKAWAFFNGKKTIIGGFLLGVAVYIDPNVMVNIPYFMPMTLQKLIGLFGTLLYGGGLTHKIIKGGTDV